MPDRSTVNTPGLLAVIETREAMEGYLLIAAQGQDDDKRPAQRCIEAIQ